jgi:hypothetical protein
LTEVRSDGRLKDLNLECKGKRCKAGLREGIEERSSEGVYYGPGITKETKSEATIVFTSVLNTSTEVLSHSTVRRCVSGLEMGRLMHSIVLSKQQKSLGK